MLWISSLKTHVIPVMFIIDCGVVDKTWRRKPISFKHVSLHDFIFFNPH